MGSGGRGRPRLALWSQALGSQQLEKQPESRAEGKKPFLPFAHAPQEETAAAEASKGWSSARGKERKCHPLQSGAVTSPHHQPVAGVYARHMTSPPKPSRIPRARSLLHLRLPPLDRPLSSTFALPAQAPLSTAPAPPPPRARSNRHGGAAGARAPALGSFGRACPFAHPPPNSRRAGRVGTRARGQGGARRLHVSAQSSQHNRRTGRSRWVWARGERGVRSGLRP